MTDMNPTPGANTGHPQETVNMIDPTIGRIVWFQDGANPVPSAAIVTYVHDAHCIDVTVFPRGGQLPCPLTSLALVQPGEQPPDGAPHARWMPYQVKKTTGSESGETQAGQQAI